MSSLHEGHEPMTYGLPGQVTRSGDTVIEPKTVGEVPPDSYGHAVSLTDKGQIVKVSATCPVLIYAFLAGAYPRLNVDPESKRTDNAMRRGYMAVPVQKGDPYPGCPVHVRVAAETDILRIGGVEAEADGANTVEVKGVNFTSVLDANNLAEIYALIIN